MSHRDPLVRIAEALEDRSALGEIKHALFELRHDQRWCIDRIRDLTDEIRVLVALHEAPAGGPSLGASVTAIYGRSHSMPINVPVPKLLDTEKIELGVMPRKADGHIDNAAVLSWVSSDASQVEASVGTVPFDFEDVHLAADGVTEEWREVVTCPGNFKCTALTPLTLGSASVTASAPGYDSAIFGPINYEQGVARSLNPSVGSPVSDL